MSKETQMNKSELLTRMEKGWQDFQAYVATLTPEQITVATDAAGWTVKDHIMHLAVWEDGMFALLNGQSRRERMGVDEATWKTPGYDAINAAIQKQHSHMTPEDVMRAFNEVHEGLVSQIQDMSDADLHQPYNHYQPGSKRTRPVIDFIRGNTYEHYAQHRSWMAAIVGNG